MRNYGLRVWLGLEVAGLILVLHLGQVAWARGEGPPEWAQTRKPPAQYAGAGYLVGIGQAAGKEDVSLEAAKNAARADIGSKIQAQVQSTLTDRIEEQQKYTQKKGKTRSTTEGTQQVVSEIMTKVSVELVATDIKETYFNKREKQGYAIAVMDRGLAADVLRKRFTLTRQAADGFYKEGQQALKQNDVARARQNFKKAKDQLLEIEGKQALLDVISGQVSPISPEQLTVWKCDLAMDQAMDSIRFVVQVYETNPTAQTRGGLIQSQLIKGLRAKGYNVMDNAATFAGHSYDQLQEASVEQLRALPGLKGNYLILGDAVAKPSSTLNMGSSPVYFFMTSARLKIVNLDNGKIMIDEAFDWGTQTKSGKSTPGKAASDSLTKAGQFLGDTVSDKVEEIFKSLQ